MSNFSGRDGAASYAAVTVGELRSWSLDGVEVETIEDTVKGDAARTHKVGLGDGGTATLTAFLDYVTAQQDIIDHINTPTGIPSGGVAIVLTVDTGKTFSFNAMPTTYTTTSPEGSGLVEATFTLKVTGAISMAWA